MRQHQGGYDDNNALRRMPAHCAQEVFVTRYALRGLDGPTKRGDFD
jgi:hypothetical protein